MPNAFSVFVVFIFSPNVVAALQPHWADISIAFGVLRALRREFIARVKWLTHRDNYFSPAAI